MKHLFLTLFFIIYTEAYLSAQQTTLFNRSGEAIAYIDDKKDATVFLWDGTPVAFLVKEKKDFLIVGFNGRVLGWYVNGIVYDTKGEVIGGKKDSLTIYTRLEGVKGIQKIIPIKSVLPIVPIQPIFKRSWSSIELKDLLLSGKK